MTTGQLLRGARRRHGVSLAQLAARRAAELAAISGRAE
jgi:hypothetical protein